MEEDRRKVPIRDSGRNSSARSIKMSSVDGDKVSDEGSGRKKVGRSLLPARRLEQEERATHREVSGRPDREMGTKFGNDEHNDPVPSTDN